MPDPAGLKVILVPVVPDDVTALMTGHVPPSLAAQRVAGIGRGWPHADTAPALSFIAGDGRVWLIVDDAGAVVGECGTKGPPDAGGTVEIGYGLAGPSRGRGLGSRAVRALVAELRSDPRIRAIEAEVVADNVASRRVLERAGFVEVGGDHTLLRYRAQAPGPGPGSG